MLGVNDNNYARNLDKKLAADNIFTSLTALFTIQSNETSRPATVCLNLMRE